VAARMENCGIKLRPSDAVIGAGLGYVLWKTCLGIYRYPGAYLVIVSVMLLFYWISESPAFFDLILSAAAFVDLLTIVYVVALLIQGELVGGFVLILIVGLVASILGAINVDRQAAADERDRQTRWSIEQKYPCGPREGAVDCISRQVELYQQMRQVRH
jgi:hypothetical protein